MDDADVQARPADSRRSAVSSSTSAQKRSLTSPAFNSSFTASRGGYFESRAGSSATGTLAMEPSATAGQHPHGVAVLQQQLGVLADQELDAADDGRAGEVQDANSAGSGRRSQVPGCSNVELGTGTWTGDASGHGLVALLQPRQALLQLLDALLERLDRLGLGVGEASDRPGVREAHADRPARARPRPSSTAAPW